MKILVNDHELDHTLEDENTVGEVIDAVATWLRANGRSIVEAQLDGETVRLEPNQAWRADAVDTVDTLGIRARDSAEIKLDGYDAIIRYLDGLSAAIETGDAGELADRTEELETVRETVGMMLSEHTELVDSISESLASTPDTAHTPIESLRTIVAGRIAELSDPLREAAVTAALLSRLVPDVQDVSVRLQTSRDDEAIATIIRFTELLGKLVRLLPAVIAAAPELSEKRLEGATLGEFTRAFNAVLNELSEAFVSGDYVLIGDVLEYEIAPRIESLVAYLPFGERENNDS
ncbi:MAG: hypothetical protein EA426_07120 [Spirochaetaceae bacterium]|nr:MAG: hypothetical protein EA426_07120 [Spirochaetaceae bacterium]